MDKTVNKGVVATVVAWIGIIDLIAAAILKLSGVLSNGQDQLIALVVVLGVVCLAGGGELGKRCPKRVRKR